MAAEPERIANRGSTGWQGPAWILRYDWIVVLVLALLAIGYIVGFPSPNALFGWYYLVLAGLFGLMIWYWSIAWVEIGPESLRVRYNGRSRAIPMSEIINIEAHRHWRNPLLKGQDPAYYLLLHRTSKRAWPKRGWLLTHLTPAAGDRLLYDLYRFNKPIRVYNWK